MEIAAADGQGPVNLRCGKPVIAPSASPAAFVCFSPIKAFKCERQRAGCRATPLSSPWAGAMVPVTSLTSTTNWVCVSVRLLQKERAVCVRESVCAFERACARTSF